MIAEERDGPVKWLTFDRPDRLNAFTAQGYREFRVPWTLRSRRSDPGRGGDRTRASVFGGADRSLLDPTSTATDVRTLAMSSVDCWRFLRASASRSSPR